MSQVAGVRADATVRPRDLREARDVMLASQERGQTLLFRGGGTKLEWGARPERVDLVVDTGGLDRLLAHNPGDFTAAVQAGMPLARLQAELAPAGQWLAIESPYSEAGATVGGVLAAGDAGPRQQRYGAMRDLVIGVTVVLSDGAVGRAGGRVIKNVAGYDLGKLLCGSLGTLGLVAEVVVRLHPLPDASATVRIPADAAAATAATLRLLACPVVPSAIDWGEDALWVRLESTEAGVAAQAEAVADLADRQGLGSETLAGEQEAEAWRRLLAAVAGRPGQTVARASTPPDRLGAAAEALQQAAAEAGLPAPLVSHAGRGLHTACIGGEDPSARIGGEDPSARIGGEDPSAHAAAVHRWRRRVAALGGSVVVRRRAPGVDAHLDPWGPPPPGLALMRRVKQQLDPGRRCAPGRFVGGL